MSSIAALAVSPCLITSAKASLNFGVLEKRLFKEKIQFQILKALKEENEEVRELHRARRVI
jgi:hypothetical protein